MIRSEAFPGARTSSSVVGDSPAKFPWIPAIILSTVLFLAEAHSPALVIDGDSDGFVAQSQGSVLRQFCYVSIALIGIIYLFRAKSCSFTWRRPVALAWALLVGWCMLSTLWAQEPVTSAKRILAYLFMVTGAAGMSVSWSRKHVLQFISLSGAAHLTAGIVAELATGYFTPWISGYRFAGTQSWNVQGFCCLLMVLASVAAADSDPRHKFIFRTLAIYGLTFLMLTRSRSSLMGIAVGYLIYFLLTRSLVTKVRFGLAASTSVLILYISGLLTSMFDFFSRSGEGVEDLTGRQPLWELLATFVKLRPMTGYGYQSFWTAKNVDYFAGELHWPVSSAHNSYLDNIITLGFVGLILHASVLIFGVVGGSSLFKKTRSPIFAVAAAMCAVFLVVGMLEATVVITAGPYNFGVTLLLWVLCLEGPNRDELDGSPLRRRLRPGPAPSQQTGTRCPGSWALR